MKKKPATKDKIINHPDFGPIRMSQAAKLKLIERCMNNIPADNFFDIFPKIADTFWQEVDDALQSCSEKELVDLLDQYGDDLGYK